MRSTQSTRRKRTYKSINMRLNLHEYAEYVDFKGTNPKSEELLISNALLVIDSAFMVISQDLICLSTMSEIF